MLFVNVIQIFLIQSIHFLYYLKRKLIWCTRASDHNFNRSIYREPVFHLPIKRFCGCKWREEMKRKSCDAIETCYYFGLDAFLFVQTMHLSWFGWLWIARFHSYWKWIFLLKFGSSQLKIQDHFKWISSSSIQTIE